MRKKMIALLCMTAMTLSMVACGQESTSAETESTSKESNVESITEKEEEVKPKAPVTLVYWYRNNVGEQEYTKQVEDKLNEYLAKTEGYEHITIDLHPCKDLKTDLSLALAAGEQIDIISLPSSGSEAEHVSDGVLAPLDDYLAANPEISAELPDWLMEMGKFNGITYYVPNYQQVSNQMFVYCNKENFEATGYDYDEVQKAFYDDNHEYLYKFYEDLLAAAKETIKKEHPDTTFISNEPISNERMYVEMGQSGLPAIGSESFFYWDTKEEKISLTDLNEDLTAGRIKVGEYVEKGLIYEDYVSNREPFNNGILGEWSFVTYNLQSYGTPEMVAEQRNSNADNLAKDGEVIVFGVDDYNFVGLRNAAQGVGISSTSENPEDAANFLALLFNSKYAEFYNTLCYGIEGVHYNVIDDGKIETTEFAGSQGGQDTTYCYWKWVGGNTFNAWLNQSMTQEQEDYILNEINEGDNTVVCPLAGMIVDTKPFETELTQMQAINTEYKDIIRNGMKGYDTEACIKEYLDKLEKAGLSKVLDELNAQAEAFLSSK